MSVTGQGRAEAASMVGGVVVATRVRGARHEPGLLQGSSRSPVTKRSTVRGTPAGACPALPPGRRAACARRPAVRRRGWRTPRRAARGRLSGVGGGGGKGGPPGGGG